VFDEDGRLVHQRGVTGSPGLSFLGLPWQHTRGSALLGWVKDDAEHVTQHMAASQRTKPRLVPARRRTGRFDEQ
jgi:putative flavoprotein involved in K+ transport